MPDFVLKAALGIVVLMILHAKLPPPHKKIIAYAALAPWDFLPSPK